MRLFILLKTSENPLASNNFNDLHKYLHSKSITYRVSDVFTFYRKEKLVNIQVINAKNRVLPLLFWLLILSSAQATELIFTPSVPTVEVGQQLTLSVSGTSGDVTWTPSKGQIQGAGNQVTYIAPLQAGLEVVLAFDSEGNVGTVKIVILPAEISTVSLENASWELFSERNINTLAFLSEDDETIWLGTDGGLEQRDIATGQLLKVLTKSDGLPSNDIHELQPDNNNGLWIGTEEGLAYLNSTGQITKHVVNGSKGSAVNKLVLDEKGGLWVGTGNSSHEDDATFHGGLFYRDATGLWRTEDKWFDDSGTLHHSVHQMVSDGNGGLWVYGYQVFSVKTPILIMHYTVTGEWKNVSGEWKNFASEHHVGISHFVSDGKGGVWIISGDDGVHHLNDTGKLTTQFTPEYFGLTIEGIVPLTIKPLLVDEKGNLWVTGKLLVYGEIEYSFGFLAYRTPNGEWHQMNKSNSALLSDEVYTIYPDKNDRLWITTSEELAYLDKTGQITKFYTFDTEGYLGTPLADGKGGLWIFGGAGLFYREPNGHWATISDVPIDGVGELTLDNRGGLWVAVTNDWDTQIAHRNKEGKWDIVDQVSGRFAVLMVDKSDNLWIGTHDRYLTRRSIIGKKKVFSLDNSIGSLASDGKGGVWVGTWDGLVHMSADEQWTVFDSDKTNSSLPQGRGISSLFTDANDGLWVGFASGSGVASSEERLGGLVYRDANGDWTRIYINDSTSILRFDQVSSIIADGSGGIWVGLRLPGRMVAPTDGGLAHRNAIGEWTVFNSVNSELPHDSVWSIASDGHGGLWVYSGRGSLALAHLTFGQKNQICTQTNTETCETILTGKRAAIIIAGGGAQSTNSLWDTTEAISNRIYKVFYNRGFDKSEIYYLSPKSWADFNGDGRDDRITRTKEEGTLTVEDVRAALDWAKTAGELDQPLYLFFIDHGGPGKLQLAKNTQMKADEFKAILDDYQNTTGNKLVLVIEACYSGSLVKALAAPNRAIISSAKENELAYFVEKRGFTDFLADNLLKGMNFFEAFNLAVPKQDKLLGNSVQQLSGAANSTISTRQTPQLDDNTDGIFTTDDGQWLKQVYVNGNFVTGDFTLAVESLTTSTGLSVDQAVILKAKASTAVGQVVRVWAVVRPPKINLVLDSNGTPILAYPRSNLSRTEEENVWQTSWNDAVYNGDYEITFYAEDNDGNIASSDNSVIISVTSGIEPPPQANVQIVLEKDSYRSGEYLKAELIENLGWGYDLYAAVAMPDGNFLAFKNTNHFAAVNEAKKWLGQRKQNSPATLVDFTLPANLPTGEYCLYGILSPEKEDVFETLAQGLSVIGQRCFEVK